MQIKTCSGKIYDIHLYPEMNDKISDMLKIHDVDGGKDASGMGYLYAAAYIDYLRAENKKLKEALGRSVKLPLKIGDTVYVLSNRGGYKLYEYYIVRIYLSVDKSKVKIKRYVCRCKNSEYGSIMIDPEYFRKSYNGNIYAFKTQKAAEKKLEELEKKYTTLYGK